MKFPLQTITLLLTLTFLSFQSQAQTIDTIRGCDNFPQTAAEISSCTICDFDVLYGSTFDYTSNEDLATCATFDKDQYVGFVTNSSGDVVTVLFSEFGCINGSGLEVGVYDRFNEQILGCFAPRATVYRFPNLDPNQLYFLRIDGLNGDECEFNINFLSGITAQSNCTDNISATSSLQAFKL